MGRRWTKSKYGPIQHMLEDAPREVKKVYMDRPAVAAVLISGMMTWLTDHPQYIQYKGVAYCRYALAETHPVFKRESRYADGITHQLFEHVRKHALTHFKTWVMDTHSNDQQHLYNQLKDVSSHRPLDKLQPDLF